MFTKLELLNSLDACFNKHIVKQGMFELPKIWVAFSGGLDSTALLYAAHQFSKGQLNQEQGIAISAIHVNHNLSPNAKKWQEHCVAECQKLDIDCVIKSVHLNNKEKGLEAAARDARYQAFAEVIAMEETQNQQVLLLGQHQDDQLETFFLQLLRGAGPAGLSAMPEFIENKYGSKLLRPFLSVSKEQLLQLAQSEGWSWVEDESNQKDNFDRNYLRNQIMPLLQSRWPATGKVVSRSIKHIQQQEFLISESVQQKLRIITTKSGQVILSLLKDESHTWQKQLIKTWITQFKALQPSESVLKRIIQDCVYARKDAQPKVTWGQWQCCRFAGALYLLPQYKDLSGQRFAIKPEQTVALPDNLGDYEVRHLENQSQINEPQSASAVFYIEAKCRLEIRFGGFSQRFKPVGEKHSKPINQWFKQWQVPPWQRVRTPILLADDEIVAVGDIVAERFSKVESSRQYCTFSTSKSRNCLI